MFPLSPSSRLLLEAVVALALTPVAVELAMTWRAVRRGRGRARRAVAAPPAVAVAALGVAVALSIVFVVRPHVAEIDAADLGRAMAAMRQRGETAGAADLAALAVQQSRGRVALPGDVSEALLRAGRFGDLQYYFGGLLARDADLDWTDLLVLARTARQSGWQRMDAMDHLAARAATRPEKRAAAAILALTNGARATQAVADARFTDGARAAGGPPPPLAAFEGWSARDAGNGRCDVLVYFTPVTELDGKRVWLHAYPPEAHEYIDVGTTFPTSVWKAGEPAWEMFDSPAPRGSNLYAGVASGSDLGPAVELGRVMGCGAAAAAAR